MDYCERKQQIQPQIEFYIVVLAHQIKHGDSQDLPGRQYTSALPM